MEQQNRNPTEDNNYMLISMILNIIRMEILKSGKLLGNEVAKFSKQKYKRSVSIWISDGTQYLGHTYTKKLFIAYLKFRFNWTSCIISDDPTRGLSVQLHGRGDGKE